MIFTASTYAFTSTSTSTSTSIPIAIIVVNAVVVFFSSFFASQRHADIAEGLASKLEDFASVSVPIPRPLDANGQARPLPTQWPQPHTPSP